MLYRLIVLTGPLKNQRITVDREPMKIGRAPECRIALPDEEVAQQHAVLEDRGEAGLHIRDLGTMHKVIVNGREFRESRLKHGDMVEIGRTRFLVQAIVAADVAGPSDDPDERANPRLILAIVLVVVLAAITWYRWPQIRGKPSPPEASPEAAVTVLEEPPGRGDVSQTNEDGKAVTSFAASPTSVAQVRPPPELLPFDEESSQVTEKIEKMRADLLAMREEINELTRPPEGDSVLVTMPAEPAPPSISVPPTPVVMSATQALAVAAPPANTSTAATVFPDAASSQNSSPPTSLPVRPPPVELTNQVAGSATLPDTIPSSPLTGPVMRILNVEQSRFPAGDDFDDMRTFNIALSQTDTRVEILNTRVSIDLVFYDVEQPAGNVHESRLVGPMKGLRPTQAWDANRRCTVSATYVLPKGARKNEKAEGRDESYYGFIVRVFYQDALQDEWCLPRGLIKAVSTTNAVAETTTASLTEEAP